MCLRSITPSLKAFERLNYRANGKVFEQTSHAKSAREQSVWVYLSAVAVERFEKQQTCLSSFSSAEVEASYKKALEQEEERITYQRKMLLLSVKKIRERENEMLIQGRNCLLRQRVEASESELESMLHLMEKQVNLVALRRFVYKVATIPRTTDIFHLIHR